MIGIKNNSPLEINKKRMEKKIEIIKTFLIGLVSTAIIWLLFCVIAQYGLLNALFLAFAVISIIAVIYFIGHFVRFVIFNKN